MSPGSFTSVLLRTIYQHIFSILKWYSSPHNSIHLLHHHLAFTVLNMIFIPTFTWLALYLVKHSNYGWFFWFSCFVGKLALIFHRNILLPSAGRLIMNQVDFEVTGRKKCALLLTSVHLNFQLLGLKSPVHGTHSSHLLACVTQVRSKFPNTFLYSRHIPLASCCTIHLNQKQSPWRWRHNVSLKCQNMHLLNGVTAQKRTIKWKNNCHEKLKTHIGHPLNELYICTCPSP